MNSGGCVVPRKEDVGGAEEGEKGVSGLSHQYPYVPDCLTCEKSRYLEKEFCTYSIPDNPTSRARAPAELGPAAAVVKPYDLSASGTGIDSTADPMLTLRERGDGGS